MRNSYKVWMGTEGQEESGIHVFDASPATVRDWARWWSDFEADKPGAAMTIDVTGESAEGLRRLIEVNQKIEPNAHGGELAFTIDTVRSATVLRDEGCRLGFVLHYVSAVLDQNEADGNNALRVAVYRSTFHASTRISVATEAKAKEAAKRIAQGVKDFWAKVDPFEDRLDVASYDLDLVLEAF